jgi:activating signal cointegrator complex subunit 3
LKWTVIELSGDTNHDRNVLERADVLVCTPEKWDLISRSWRDFKSSGGSPACGKDFMFRVCLLVLDEVHLLGEERGAVLEAIVSRTRFISRILNERDKEGSSDGAGLPKNAAASESTRIIGLSTALANPGDLADWIGIDMKSHGPRARRGLYNFRPSVRPVPTKVGATVRSI